MRTTMWAACLALQAAMAAPAGVTEGAGDLARDFACEVATRLDVPEDEQLAYAAMLRAALARHAPAELAPQHFLLVDRNRHVQAALLYRLTPGGELRFAGAGPVSTGLPGGYEHFDTPLGVFEHVLENHDFRAEGTPNEHGIRGYGRAGLRVFDFGWVRAPRGWGDHREGEMRLQLHATDPVQLERWLGVRRSKGCIRIPASMNEFLDRRGVLDAEYEERAAAGKPSWVLRPDREPTRWPGRYLVVVDSGRDSRPAWSPDPRSRTRWPVARPLDCP